MSSVRDRIKAAEAAEGNSKSDSTETTRRGHKLSLKTDEHIKEEFLRRGDGGWLKKVDIGQQEKFSPPTTMPPIIKLTTDTPVATKKKELPKKLSKEVPGAFEPVVELPEVKPGKEWTRVEQMEAEQQAMMDAEAAKDGDGDWNRVERMEAEQQAAMEAEAAAAKAKAGETKKSSKKSTQAKQVPVGRYENLLHKEKKGSTSTKQSRERSRSDNSHISEEGSHEEHEPRERVLFDPIEYAERKAARRERRASRQQARAERLSIHEDHKEKTRAQSPSFRFVRTEHDDERHKGRSRSRSTSKQDHDHRRSAPSLWPSFSSPGRKSMSAALDGILDPFTLPVRRPSHSRTNSHSHDRPSHRRTTSDDIHSMHSTASTISPRKLEFAEYIAGKRVNHLSPDLPPKSPPRPMGFVRSRSHTGQYSEGYTREKKLLRKPSADEEVLEFEDGHARPKVYRKSSGRHHERHDEREEEGWGLGVLNFIARG